MRDTPSPELLEKIKTKLKEEFGLTDPEIEALLDKLPWDVIEDAVNHTGLKTKQALKMALVWKYKIHQAKYPKKDS